MQSLSKRHLDEVSGRSVTHDLDDSAASPQKKAVESTAKGRHPEGDALEDC